MGNTADYIEVKSYGDILPKKGQIPELPMNIKRWPCKPWIK